MDRVDRVNRVDRVDRQTSYSIIILYKPELRLNDLLETLNKPYLPQTMSFHLQTTYSNFSKNIDFLF